MSRNIDRNEFEKSWHNFRYKYLCNTWHTLKDANGQDIEIPIYTLGNMIEEEFSGQVVYNWEFDLSASYKALQTAQELTDLYPTSDDPNAS